MKLIVGLGNVGEQYSKTRHNVGFMVIDALIDTLASVSRQDKFSAELISSGTGDDKLLLAKPHTMMNLSGEAVGQLMRFYKIAPNDVWVTYDDVDVPFGTLRVRRGGGSAGHNGIKSLIAHCGDDFWRYRVGVGNDKLAATPTDQYVLDGFLPEEQAKLPMIIEQTVDVLQDALASSEPTDTTYKLI